MRLIYVIVITAAIPILLLLVPLLALGVPPLSALSALGTILSLALTLMFYSWRKGIEQAKADFRLIAIGRKGIFRTRIDRTNPSLLQFFISDSREERRISSFFTFFLGYWGFVTTMWVTAVGVVQVFSTDFDEIPAPIITWTGESPGKIPAATSATGFTFGVLYYVVPYSIFAILSVRVLTISGLRRIRKHNIVSQIPRYPLDTLGGLTGIGSFALFFFRGIATDPIALQLAVNYSLFYAMLVSIPIAMFSFFHVYGLEPKIRDKFREYLTSELGLKVTSVKNPNEF